MEAIHLYDSKTGAYVRSFQSRSEAEQILGLYRGAVTDYMRSGIKAKQLFLTEKHDCYPAFQSGQLQKSLPEQESSHLLSEEQIRAKHDMFFRILSYVRIIPEGQFTDETSLLRHLEIAGKPRYREALSRPELKDFKGKVDGTVYYGHPNSIRKLKSEGVLQ